MRYAWMLVGAIFGGRSRLFGALLGGVVGYGLGAMLEPPQGGAPDRMRPPGEPETGPGQVPNRYPEEDVLEAMHRAEEEPDARGAEQEAFYRSVTGAGRSESGHS